MKRKRIGTQSIRESLDNLPNGICFSDRNGYIILCNRTMNNICLELLENDLKHISELERALTNPKNAVPLDMDLSENEKIIMMKTGVIWKFTRREIQDKENNTYIQYHAVDVTELYLKKKEFERENERLQNVIERAKKLYSELDDIVKEEENLAIKTKVHDDIGQLLLLTRKIMSQDNAEADDIKKTAKQWEIMISALGKISEENDDGKSSVRPADLEKDLSVIGVKLVITGDFPEDRKTASLMSAAIRESAVNAVRHANGKDLYVSFSHFCSKLIAEITNSGERPKGKIKEGGGLGSLRAKTEKAGGTMITESEPVFRLVITVPEKEENKL